MDQAIFLHLTFAFPLLHRVQATNCQGDNCKTGLIISGGPEVATSIETFPDANCNIPPFPQPGRESHTLSVVDNGRQLVACGGDKTKTSCISWRSGQAEWTHYATLSRERWGHTAVVIGKMFILGGGGGKFNGEIVKGGMQLNLQNGGDRTCAAAFQGGFVTMGGAGSNWADHGKVDRYDSEGKYLESLPDLATPRWFHSCTSFLTSNGEQALLVAGGRTNNRVWLSSTELYIPSNRRWTRGGDLPRELSDFFAARLNQQVVLVGGSTDGWARNSRDEVLQYNVGAATWTQIGQLRDSRHQHAIAEVNLGAVGCVVDCKVGNWKPWGDCSATCGGGIKTREREVVEEPENGGAMCPAPETIACNTEQCPVDCQVGDWKAVVFWSVLLLALLICLAYCCCCCCYCYRKRILSRTFKRDINNDYGIYPENGDAVVMEAVNRNVEYKQQAAGGGVEDYDQIY